jgi:hypothetical protein
LIDRFGPRRIVLICMTVYGCAIASLSLLRSGLWQFYVTCFVLGVVGNGAAHLAYSRSTSTRICQPGPKTEVPGWYRCSILSTFWEFPPERFTSQAFWEAFEQILPEGPEALASADDPLEQAQLRLLGVRKEKQLVSRRLLAYDTTNFYTYIASSNPRNPLAQRGHNKQGRHNLRQVGLSYVLDSEQGLSLCHDVYPRNVADVAGQHRGLRGSRCGLDLGLALESGAAGIPQSSDGRITRL